MKIASSKGEAIVLQGSRYQESTVLVILKPS